MFQLLNKIPFTYPWILKNAIGKDVKTILDVGCGTGELMVNLSKGENWGIVGVDIYGPALKKAKKTGVYKELYQSDILKLPKNLTKRKYDVVFSSQVVEHLPKEKALELIGQLEKLAKKRVVITTTVGFMKFNPLEPHHDHLHDENPFQKHKSGWSSSEFKEMGYISRGQGLFIIYREGYLARKLPRLVLPILQVISLAFSPIVFFFPILGTYQINYKIKNAKNK